MLIADNASVLTHLATNIPSTVEYRLEKILDNIVGNANRISHLKLTLCSNFICVSKRLLLFYLSQQQICELILCHDRRFHFVIV